MSHRTQKPFSLAFFLTICIATLSCCHLKVATALVPEDSITEVVASNKHLLGQIDSERKKTKLPSAWVSKIFSGEHDLVELILRAGDCDRAYTMMLKRNKSYLEPYCFAMALAGREDELPEKVESFRTNFRVIRRLRDEECSFEHLCEVPTRHGIALKHVVDKDYEAAVAEYQAIRKLERFGNECGQVAVSIAFEVFLASGPKDCIAVLQQLSEGKKNTFRSMFRSLSIALHNTDPQKRAELKRDLLPDHVKVFLHELALAIPVNSTVGIAELKSLIPFAVSEIPKLEEDDAGKLRAILISSDLLDSAERDRLSAQCLQWLQTKPKGDQRSAIDSITPWLLANGKLDQLKALALQYDGKDRFRYATVIKNAMHAAKHDFTNKMGEVASHLPAPEDLYTSYGLEFDIANVLIESGQFDLSQNWLGHVKDEKKNILDVKLEIYRDLLVKETLTADKFYSGAKELIAKAKTTESNFYSKIDNDFLAETAKRHGVKTALDIARRLPDEAISYKTSRANELVSALIARKRFEDVLLVADLATQKELSHRLFGLDFETASFDSQSEWIDRLGDRFPRNRHILRRQILIAIADGDRAKALNLLKRKLEMNMEFTTAMSFVYAGWGKNFYETVKQVVSGKAHVNGNRGSVGQEAVSNLIEALCVIKGNKAAIDFIDKHTKAPGGRLELYASLYSEFLGNYSTTIWMYN